MSCVVIVKLRFQFLTCLCAFHSLVWKVHRAHPVSKDTSHFPLSPHQRTLESSLIVLKLLHRQRWTEGLFLMFIFHCKRSTPQYCFLFVITALWKGIFYQARKTWCFSYEMTVLLLKRVKTSDSYSGLTLSLIKIVNCGFKEFVWGGENTRWLL